MLRDPAVRFTRHDAARPLPFPDAHFEQVFSIEGIEHFDSPWIFLQELARVLFEGGFSTRQEATTISGRGVGLDAVKAAVEREVKAIEGVQSVVNELEIAGPASYTSRSNDTLITTKVKASLVDAKDISANSFKVVTERGIVYLMGRVTQHEANKATDIALLKVAKPDRDFPYLALGSAELHAWLHEQDKVRFLPVSIVNDAAEIGLGLHGDIVAGAGTGRGPKIGWVGKPWRNSRSRKKRRLSRATWPRRATSGGPAGGRWAVDLDANWVKQRDFEGWFGHRDYSVLTALASLCESGVVEPLLEPAA